MLPRAFRFTFIFIALFIISPALPFAQNKSLKTNLKEIDEYAAKAGRDWQVPGFAMAIVKDDSVVFAKGYGMRQFGESAHVDAHTLGK